MHSCNGEILSVRGRNVAVTGKLFVEGRQVFRPEVLEKLQLSGAKTSNDRSRAVNLLVEGEQNLAHVKDAAGRSRKTVSAEINDSQGYETCIVDGRDFEMLIKGVPVVCQIHSLQ